MLIEQIELLCNAPGHEDPAAGHFPPPEDVVRITPAKLRKLAAKAGWTHVRSRVGRRFDKDYCPAHKPAEGQQDAAKAAEGG